MAGQAIQIELESAPGGGRYVARVDGMEGEAELTFARPVPQLVVARHTFAPDSMRGMGVARALVERLVADARRDGFRIASRCSYVSEQLRRNPDWADLSA